jgi:hypothetical protein
LFTSGVLTGANPSVKVDVSVAGVTELRLVVTDGGNGVGLDHADWANARLIGTQTGSQVDINYQTAAAAVPAGYLVDSGQTFANRGNGYSYGWSANHTDVVRDREINADQRLDTLSQFHAGQTWEIALPNGVYAVTMSIGDPGFSSTHTLNVEGVSFWNSELLAANEFRQRTMLVTVADGRLTLDPGSAAEKATRPNYVEIIPTAAPALFSLELADFDADGDADGADFLRWQRGLGAAAPTHADGDADADGDVDHLDLAVWRATFGPAPAAAVAAVAAAVVSETPTASPLDVADDAALGLNALEGLPGAPPTRPAMTSPRRAPFDAPLATSWSRADLAFSGGASEASGAGVCRRPDAIGVDLDASPHDEAFDELGRTTSKAKALTSTLPSRRWR